MAEKNGIVSALRLFLDFQHSCSEAVKDQLLMPVVCWSLLSNLSMAQQQLK